MIYVDFDGVIYDTLKRLEEKAGCDIKYFDLTKYGMTIDVFGEKDFYTDGYLIEKSVYYIKRLKKFGDVCILTKYCTENEKKYKKEFIDSLKIKNIRIEFVESDKDKQDYIASKDIIIDDQINNLLPNTLNNIIFDKTGCYDTDWNCVDGLNIIKTKTWQEVFKHIVFLDEIKQR